MESELLGDTNKRRVQNLRTLAARYEKQADLATAIGWTDSYLSQLIGPNPSRAVSERTARMIERKIGLPDRVLGEEPRTPAAGSGEMLDAVMLAIDTALRAGNVKLPEQKYRALVTHVYKAALRRGDAHVDREELESLLRLTQ